ncbi:MAG: KamA family radical SAM protein [Bdellovibrionaceae bacterium]|nr:KamA family radical SAM protein [Pseudobdellovibrionaceae bacterium]
MKFKPVDIQPYQGVSHTDWDSWTWQVKNSISSYEQVLQHLDLNVSEHQFFQNQQSTHFKFRMNPYTVAFLKHLGPQHPLRQIFLGTQKEFSAGTQSQFDPLGENQNNPAPRIIHRYSDRVLFLVTDFCSVYCRYCTRKHFTGKDQAFPKAQEYSLALDYIKQHKGIREVILSGGDPLTLSDSRLEKILSDLRSIDHIEIIRIGTRMPVIMPMRISESLVQMLKMYHPIYLMTHFNHPDELTVQSVQALTRLVDAGFPIMNQMVLLNGVNNHPALVQALNRRLLYYRVKPYYMFQCDPSEGTDHLRTSIQDSLAIQRELWGHMSGLSMPNLSVDIPSGGGKAYLVPDFITQVTEEAHHFKGWDGVQEKYINPRPEEIKKPEVHPMYLNEWEQTKSAKTTPTLDEGTSEVSDVTKFGFNSI